MMKYLSESYGDRATNGDKSLLDMLRDEAVRLDVLIVNYINFCSYEYRKIKKRRRKIKFKLRRIKMITP